MTKLIDTIKALSDKNRFRIMMMLSCRPLCVCEILSVLDIAGGTLSNHLKILKNAGLIEQKKDGRWIEYSISNEEVLKILDCLTKNLEDLSLIESDKDKINKINKNLCSKSIA